MQILQMLRDHEPRHSFKAFVGTSGQFLELSAGTRRNREDQGVNPKLRAHVLDTHQAPENRNESARPGFGRFLGLLLQPLGHLSEGFSYILAAIRRRVGWPMARGPDILTGLSPSLLRRTQVSRNARLHGEHGPAVAFNIQCISVRSRAYNIEARRDTDRPQWYITDIFVRLLVTLLQSVQHTSGRYAGHTSRHIASLSNFQERLYQG